MKKERESKALTKRGKRDGRMEKMFIFKIKLCRGVIEGGELLHGIEKVKEESATRLRIKQMIKLGTNESHCIRP